ncbi:GGDEF domain-containing protein [Thiomonas sp. FB-Cd]|uniref:GGDEF domain-containing protein n=1 Tax=Thiomonas sp. FB-Cd TaxID=1158292 RepID=UPI0009E0046D|nr:GGDEF domain-containing protein [Thiomonas sp. FB-Cd]
MQILMEFLQLTADEGQALAACAPQLLSRLEAFAKTIAEQIQAQADDEGAVAGLSKDQRLELATMQADHYRELLASEYTPQLQHRMVEIGALYYRWGLPPMWIMTTSSLFAAEFETFAADLSLAQRRPLMGALYKRLRRDEAWQMEGYRQAAERVRRQLERSPLRDALTGSLNGDALREMLPSALARARRHGSKVLVGLLEFDDFSALTAAQGNAVGDAVLQQLADRLRNALHKTDLVVRLEGDRFAVILEDIYRIEAVAPLLERLQMDLNLPYTLSDTVLWQCPLSIGITVFPDDNVDAPELLRHAQQAMHNARTSKSHRECFWSFYDREVDALMAAAQGLEH